MTLVDDIHTILGDTNGAVSVSGLQPTTRLDYTDINQPRSRYSPYKVIQSGTLIERYVYQHSIRYNFSVKRKLKRAHHERSEEYKVKTIVRAINTIRRLIYINFTRRDKFITLTFNNEQSIDINDLKSCLPYFQQFVRKLKAQYPNFRFLCVPEFQKRGAVHYHMLCNLPYMQNSDLQQFWPYGFTKIKALSNSTNLALYLAKYISKKFDDKKKYGHHLYYSSKGLKRPTVHYGLSACRIGDMIINDQKSILLYKNEYPSQHNGQTKYEQYYSELK